MAEKLSPHDSRKRIDEVISERKILTIGELAELYRKEGWSFGPGCDLLDYVLARRSLGKVEMFQRFPARESNYIEIHVVDASLLRRQEPPKSD